jgi:hypothetical protein
VLYFLNLLARMLLHGTAVPRIGLAVVAWWTFRCAAAALVTFVASFSNPAADPAADKAAADAAAAAAASNAATKSSGNKEKRTDLWTLVAKGAARTAELGGSLTVSAAEAAASVGWKFGKAAVTLIAGLSPCAVEWDAGLMEAVVFGVDQAAQIDSGSIRWLCVVSMYSRREGMLRVPLIASRHPATS